MTNETIFILTTLIDLSFVLAMSRLGKSALVSTIVINLILVSTFGAKLVPIFGFVTNSANVFYASIFLAVNIISEHHGKKDGLRAIWTGLFGLVLFMIMGQFVLLTKGSIDTLVFNTAVEKVFSLAPRISFASIFAYIAAQNLNVWLFNSMHKNPGRSGLWLRNIVSTSSAQLADSLVFFTIAFYGTIPWNILSQVIFTGFLLKAAVAILSTPYIYASYNAKPITAEKESLLDSDTETSEKRSTFMETADLVSKNWTIVVSKIIGVLVSSAGILVMGGWLFDIPKLTYLVEGFPTMKFSTAISFFCAGILVYSIADIFGGKRNFASVLIPISSLIITLFMMSLFISRVLGFESGIENLFVVENENSPGVNVAGVPSIATMVDFFLVIIASLYTLLYGSASRALLKYFGLIISASGISACLGYLLGVPLLYFSIEKINNGMAIHTSILFILTGVSFFLINLSIGLENKKNEH